MRDSFERYGVQALLVSVAVIWGATFVVVEDAIALYPMYGFLWWRFLLATVAFAVVFPGVFKRIDVPTLRWGVLAGVILAAGYIFQTWALDGETATTAARCAFITGMYVVMVPLGQALILRKRPRGATILGAGAALIGLFVLSGVVGGGSAAGWVFGDTLAVLCAIAYAVHMIMLGSTGTKYDPMTLAFIQLGTVAVITGSISFVREGVSVPTQTSVWVAIAITALLASTFAYAVQNWAQQRIAPSRVALILVTEPAFGGLFGWTARAVFPPAELVGAALMLLGMFISEFVASRKPPDEVELEMALEGIPVFDETPDVEPVPATRA